MTKKHQYGIIPQDIRQGILLCIVLYLGELMMHAQQLPRTVQRIALSATTTPSPKDLFAHQASILLDASLSTTSELGVAAEHIPQSGPFIFIPERKLSATRMTRMLDLMAISFGGKSRIDLKHPIYNKVAAPANGYFLTCYGESGDGKISAAEHEVTLKDGGRSPLTVEELAFRLIYFPHALDEMQFAAAGSCIDRGVKEQHVPVFHVPAGCEPKMLILGSFLWEHSSEFTRFPSCEARIGISLPH